ncbi:MAG: PorP/SprF family type IX secretion system membrane protein [Bacteroidetes bacterium]|nr:PorP/SprF family type IX secretion system membrane protein [Bacteroidota bacterium]
MKKYIVIIAAIILTVQVKAQQLQTSSMYELQGIYNNPSTAGTQATNMVGVSYRTQWSGISGSPKTATVFGSFGLPEHNIGLGGYIYRDETGPTSRTGVALQFAKHIPTGNGGIFSLGIEARGLQFAIDRAKLSSTLGADPALGTSSNKFKFDAGFGVSYNGKKLQLGAAASQLVQSKLGFYTGNLGTGESARLYRHYYFHGAYKWDIDGSTTLTPSVLFTYLPNAPLEIQGGVRVEHNELFWWGLGYRAHQSFILSAGLNINKKLTIGYAFDIYNTPNNVFDGGNNAHELLLRFNFSKQGKTKD